MSRPLLTFMVWRGRRFESVRALKRRPAVRGRGATRSTRGGPQLRHSRAVATRSRARHRSGARPTRAERRERDAARVPDDRRRRRSFDAEIAPDCVDENRSRNCGAEGATDNARVRARERRARCGALELSRSYRYRRSCGEVHPRNGSRGRLRCREGFCVRSLSALA